MTPLPTIYKAERCGRGDWIVSFFVVEPVRRSAVVGGRELVHPVTGTPTRVYDAMRRQCPVCGVEDIPIVVRDWPWWVG